MKLSIVALAARAALVLRPLPPGPVLPRYSTLVAVPHTTRYISPSSDLVSAR